MKSSRKLSSYAYVMAGIGVAGIAVTALGFALVSGLRHLLWLRMMKGHPIAPWWLWTGVVLVGIAIVAFWYRVIAAILWHRQQRLRFYERLNPLLRSFPREVHPDLSTVADWYLVDDEAGRYAFTWGLYRPKIAISSALWDALDEQAQSAVMYHEAAHARVRDPFQQTLLHVLSHALQPLGMRALYDRYLIRREVLADSAAIAACHGNDAPLLTALLATVGSTPPTETRVGLTGAMEARIAFLETGQVPSWWDQHMRQRMFSASVAVCLTVAEGLLVWCH